MPLIPANITCLTLDGDALVGVSLRAWGTPRTRQLAAQQPIEARSIDVAPDARLVLVIPAAWCSARPIGVSRAAWRGAKEELLRSIEGLFPLPAADALVGLAARTADDGADAGLLIGASRRRIEPLLDLVALAAGRKPDIVLAPHMCAPGMGLQRSANAAILERLASGGWVEHAAPFGLLKGVTRHVAVPTITAPTGLAIRLEDEPPRPITPQELALAGALTILTAGHTAAPLIGPEPRAPRRWAPAAVAALLAIACLWGAQRAQSWRLDRAAAALDADALASAPLLAQAKTDQDRARRLTALLQAAAALDPAQQPDLIADLAQAHAALPPEGFLYRADLDDRGVTLRGEAKRAGDVLRALEDAPTFQGAREIDTASAVEERALETFHVRADRVLASPPLPVPPAPAPSPKPSNP